MKILDYVSAQNWVEQCRTGFRNTSANTIGGAYEQCVADPSYRNSKWAILGCLPRAYDTPIWRERAKDIRTKLDKSVFLVIAAMKEGYEETMAQNWVEQLRREARKVFDDRVRYTFEEFSFPICAINDWGDTPEGNEVWDFRDVWLDDVTGFRHRGWDKMCGKYADFR